MAQMRNYKMTNTNVKKSVYEYQEGGSIQVITKGEDSFIFKIKELPLYNCPCAHLRFGSIYLRAEVYLNIASNCFTALVTFGVVGLFRAT